MVRDEGKGEACPRRRRRRRFEPRVWQARREKREEGMRRRAGGETRNRRLDEAHVRASGCARERPEGAGQESSFQTRGAVCYSSKQDMAESCCCPVLSSRGATSRAAAAAADAVLEFAGGGMEDGEPEWEWKSRQRRLGLLGDSLGGSLEWPLAREGKGSAGG